MSITSTTATQTGTTQPVIATPIVNGLRTQLCTNGLGQNDPLATSLLNVIEQLERSRAETDSRMTALNDRIAQLTQGTLHYCDHCIYNRVLCCLGINPCKSIPPWLVLDPTTTTTNK